MTDNLPDKAYAFIEQQRGIKLTEREKMLMHVYYGILTMMIEDAEEEEHGQG